MSNDRLTVNLSDLGIVDLANPKTSPECVCDKRIEYLGNGRYRCQEIGKVTAEFCNKLCTVKKQGD